MTKKYTQFDFYDDLMQKAEDIKNPTLEGKKKMSDKTCANRIQDAMASRTLAIQKMLDWDTNEMDNPDYDNGHPEYGPLNEYGLAFDFCVAGNGNETGYFSYQLSCGGPAEEIRFLTISPHTQAEDLRIQFVFMDWGDCAKIDYDETNGRETMETLWRDFQETGVIQWMWEKEIESIRDWNNV